MRKGGMRVPGHLAIGQRQGWETYELVLVGLSEVVLVALGGLGLVLAGILGALGKCVVLGAEACVSTM